MNIFSPIVNKDKISNILISLGIKKTLVSAKHVFIPELEDKDFLSKHSIVKNETWNSFAERIMYENRFHTDILNLEKLESYFSFLVQEYKKGTKFYRARISDNDNGFVPEEMSSPPKGLAKSGRANSEGISRLYLAASEKTAIHEIVQVCMTK